MPIHSFNLCRPILRSQLLLSTALIGLGTILSPSAGHARDYYLDNTTETGDRWLNPESGSWSSDDEIWRKSWGGGKLQALPEEGAAAVLTTGKDGNPVTLTLDDEDSISPDEIRLRSGTYDLEGGVIESNDNGLLINNEADGDGETLTIGSTLAGDVTIGGGTGGNDEKNLVIYTGDSTASNGGGTTALLDRMTVNEGAKLLSSGTTTGRLINWGNTTLGGTHDGGVENHGTIDTSGALITQNLENHGVTNVTGGVLSVGKFINESTSGPGGPERGKLTIDADATLSAMDTGWRGGISNEGDLNLSGTLEAVGAINNQAGGVMRLFDGATLKGRVVNQAGDEEGSDAGAIRIGTDATVNVNGELKNKGLIQVGTRNSQAVLNVEAETGSDLPGRFINNGEIRVVYPGSSLDISADEIILGGDSDLELDNIALFGNITNKGKLEYARNATLQGNLSNLNPRDGQGNLIISSTVNAGGYDVRNTGRMVVKPQLAADGVVRGGKIGNVAGLTNSGTLTIGTTDDKVGTVVTQTLDNTGIIDLDGKLSAYSTTNKGHIELDGDFEVVSDGAGNAGTFTNGIDGKVTVSGSLSADGGSVVNGSRGSVVVAGGSVTAADLQNRGDLLVNTTGNRVGTVAANIVNNSGKIDLRGALEVVGDDAGNAGTFTNEEKGEVTVSGSLAAGEGSFANEAGGSVAVAGGGSITAADLQNRGDLLVNATDDNDGTVAANIVNNSGKIDLRGALEVVSDDAGNAGTFTNGKDGKVTVSGSLAAGEGGFVNEAGGLVTVTGGGSVAAADLQNDGNLTLADGSIAAAALQNKGDLLIGGGSGKISADSFANTGTVNVKNLLSVEIAGEGTKGSFTNKGNGEITVSGRLVADDDMFVNEARGLVSLKDGAITVDSLKNAGTVSGTGTITGNISNTGELDVSGTILAGRIDNTGDLSMSGTISGDITNNKTLDVAGDVTGNIENHGALTASGSISGHLSHQGDSFDVDGDLSVGSLGNQGDITIESSDTLTSGGNVENSGSITVSGELSSKSGAINNRGADAKLILSGGTVDGDIANSSTIIGDKNGNSTVNGTVTQGKDALLQVDGALDATRIRNAGTVRVSGGKLVTEESFNNNDEGVLQLDDATIAGNIINNRDATIDVISDSTIEDNLKNLGTIDVTGAGHRELSVDGIFTNDGIVAATPDNSSLTIRATEIVLNDGSEIDVDRVTLVGAVQNSVDLNYSKDAALNGALNNTALGEVTISAAVDGGGFNITNKGGLWVTKDADSRGDLDNVGKLTNSNAMTIDGGASVSAERITNTADGEMRVAGALNSSTGEDIVNKGALRISGKLGGGLENSGGTTTLNNGRIAGDVTNSATISGAGVITGSLTNESDGIARLAGSVGAVENQGTLTTNGDLSVAGLANENITKVNAGHVLASEGEVSNGGTLQVSGTLQAQAGLENSGRTMLNDGVIDGDVENSGRLAGSGAISGKLTHMSQASLDLDGALSVGSLMNEGAFSIDAEDTLIAGSGTKNNGRITVAGALTGDVENTGDYQQTGTLDGSLSTTGDAKIGGHIAGDLNYQGGTLELWEGASIAKTLHLEHDYGIGAGQRVNASNITVHEDVELQLDGAVSGNLTNDGNIDAGNGALVEGMLVNHREMAAGNNLHVKGNMFNNGDFTVGNNARIDGQLANNGRLSLQNGRANDVMHTGGLKGTGVYALDVDLGEFSADRIVVEDGAATGNYQLELTYKGNPQGTRIGEYVTLLDVDETQGAKNDFTYSYNPTDLASERIVYSVEQNGANGDLRMISQTNPAIGAIFGSVTLTQSLIGAVVNRPTSPFVTGLAFDAEDNPCGVGSWGRVTGGHAKATGATDNGVSNIESTVQATYYGMQVGTDFACFDDRYGGWNMAFGGFLGVNQGDTTQPVYAVDGRNSQQITKRLSSRNESEFDQLYGGIYLTATKGRMQADLQYRYERTDFTIENIGVTGGGLGLDDDFASKGSTLSGSFSYVFPVGDKGWSVVPNVGFAYSRLSTDSIEFQDGDRIDFEDSETQIGFAGATVAKTFVQSESNSALYAFATGTVYKDFSDPSVSVFTSRNGDPQRLESDNLGTYGEISVGANYVKVLQPGTGLRPRQISASARIDARTGDGLESVGVTGQLRLQF